MLEPLLSARGLAVLAIAAYVGYIYYLDLCIRRKLPPGPKPLPIIGNILDLPPSGVPEYQHWLHHKDKYGPVSSISILGTTMVIMHDEKAVHEILQRRLIKTSGRPVVEFASRMCGYERLPGIRTNDNHYRQMRKFINQELNSKSLSARFDKTLEDEANWQLVRSLDSPENWISHSKAATGAVILKTTYGYNLDRNKPDLLLKLMNTAMSEVVDAFRPMTWAVDIIPALRYLPDWFPGTSFKKVARKYKQTWDRVAYTPFRFVERQMAANTHKPSLVSRLIEKNRPNGDKTTKLKFEDEEAIVWGGSGLYVGALDSSAIVFEIFTLAMAIFPEIQRKAQEEIDRVIGPNRFPEIKDRDSLPYINGVVKEVMRWWPVAPLGVLHKADEEIEYNGLLIPKNAMLIPAVWWLLHNPDVYPNPESFDTERYISPRNEPDPGFHLFGYGRRRCPGEFIGDTRLYLNVAKSLAAFDIKKATNPDGTEIPILPKPKPGGLCYPEEFQFRVTPRSQKHADLVRRTAASCKSEISDIESVEVQEK